MHLLRALGKSDFRSQLTLVFAAGILFLALASSITLSWLASRTEREDLLSQGQQLVENLARESTLAVLYGSGENASESARTTLSFPNVVGVGVYDLDGTALLTDGDARFGSLPAPEAIPDESEVFREVDQAWHFVAPVYSLGSDGEEAPESPFEVSRPDAEKIGTVRLVLSKAQLHAAVLNIFLVNITASLLLAGLLMVVLRYVTDLISQPLKDLSAIMKRSEEGQSGVRAPMRGPRDITDMAHAFNKMMTVLEEREEQLRQARDAAIEMARMKSDFAASVSHELRTPLNGILGMLDLLTYYRLPAKQQEYLDVARHSADRLLSLINDILDFSKAEAGKLDLEENAFDLRQTLEQLLDLLASAAHKKGLDIGYVMTPSVPRRLVGKSLGLEQILTNLVGNAVKFTEEGEVAIEVDVLGDDDDKATLEFRIADTGVGISEAARERIFESFAQADTSTTRRFGGTGLGLAITRRLVHELGGDINVDSEPGVGSTFRISLPFQRDDAPTAEEAGSVPDRRALVVHRPCVTRRFIERTLADWGVEHELADDQSSARDKLTDAAARGQAFDMVLLDDSLAGTEVLDWHEQGQTGAGADDCRIVLVTDNRREAEEQFDRHPSVAGYLTRPVHHARLYSCVTDTLEPLDAVGESADPGRRRLNGHVLVVEDNVTNQQVAVGMLESLGCTTGVAQDGVEAIDMHRRSRFDLILMDCNMPNMDGYEATRRIRETEDAQGRVPILALTANALEGDGERCLEAGMDDYLPKPLSLETLRGTMERWLPQPASAAESSVSSVRDMPATEAIEQDTLDERTIAEVKGAVGEGFEPMVRVFLEDVQGHLEAMELAVEEQDGERLRKLGHVLKGSSRNLGAKALAELARRIETLGGEGRYRDSRRLLDVAHREYARVGALLEHQVEQSEGEPSPPRDVEDVPQVLVVDDDRGTRLAMRYALENDGYRIVEAADGVEAVRLCEEMRPDVVVMDALMPELDGFEACRQIRELPSLGHVPVLIITALEDEASVDHAFDAGATDFIAKPVHYSVLRQRLGRIVHASRSERQAHHLASHDALTGLANRRLFHEELERTVARARGQGRAFTVMLLDLDRFKNVNETLDHEIGDVLLKSVSERLARSLRAGDLIARLGGDEFGILLRGAGTEDVARRVADKLVEVVGKGYIIREHDIFISTSVGIAIYPAHGTNARDLLKRAETAMYGAKEQAESYRFYEPMLEEAVTRHMELERDIRRGLEQENFAVYYQPLIDLESGRLSGAEALVRWEHPERGVIPPNEFITLAETTGLILPLGEWVLREACRQIWAWQCEGFQSQRISVNLSGRQLQQRDFVDLVAQILEETGLPAEQLTLEITESPLLEDTEYALGVLHGLRRMGVQLAVDDFGTGYSALSYLKQLPIDILKIDRSFVRDITTDGYDAAMLKGIVELAHSIGLKVVAEGVETLDQRDFLARHHCDLIQGFLISEPLSTTAYQDRILSQAASSAQGGDKVIPLPSRQRKRKK